MLVIFYFYLSFVFYFYFFFLLYQKRKKLENNEALLLWSCITINKKLFLLIQVFLFIYLHTDSLVFKKFHAA